MKASGPTLQELKDAKNNLRGRSLLGLEDSSEVAEWHAKQELFLATVESPEAWLKKHDAVTAVDVVGVAKDILNLDRMRVAAIGPYHNSDEFLPAAGLAPSQTRS
jgi:predicted Zn-dependent peptidase